MTDGGGPIETWCPGCGTPVPEDALKVCIICRGRFCPSCAVAGYGREFCSERCRDYFFFGDAEEEEETDGGD